MGTARAPCAPHGRHKSKRVDSLLNINRFFFLERVKGKPLSFLSSGGDGGTGHLLDGGYFELKEFGAVVGLMVFEHGVNGVQEFAHDGDEGLHFEFAFGQQVLIESAQVGVVLDGDESGHKQGVAQVFISGLGDARFFVHRSSRVELAGIESGKGHPLACLQVGSE